jgi:hypothetical protein
VNGAHAGAGVGGDILPTFRAIRGGKDLARTCEGYGFLEYRMQGRVEMQGREERQGRGSLRRESRSRLRRKCANGGRITCQLAAWVLAVAVGFGSTAAQADQVAAENPGASRKLIPLQVEGHLSIAYSDKFDWAPGLGGSVNVRAGPFLVGAGADVETQVLGYSRVEAALRAGMFAALGDFELDAVGLLGIAYMGSGPKILSEDPGAGGSIALIGARGGLCYVVKTSYDNRERLALGLGFSYEHDLDPYTIEYEYIERNWLFDDDEYPATGSVRIGADRMVFMLSLAGSFE